ncbi:MAG: hypothetical protein JAY90_07800 [Candidatus Thiodiazotropha lotti]|nr:hypothetical protein [Candidatus Thiodiazotropha lotti]
MELIRAAAVLPGQSGGKRWNGRHSVTGLRAKRALHPQANDEINWFGGVVRSAGPCHCRSVLKWSTGNDAVTGSTHRQHTRHPRC